MIKVLQVFGAMNCGGAENMIMNIYRNLDRNKVQFDFLCCTNDMIADYDEEILNLGAKIYRIPLPTFLKFFSHMNYIKKIIKKYGPYDAIHIHTLLHAGIVSYVAKKCKIKNIVVHSHSTNSGRKSSFYRNLYEKISRRLIKKNATSMIACGKDAGNYLFGNKNMKNGKVLILKNAIEADKFISVDNKQIDKIRKEWHVNSTDIVIGQIGRLVSVKNHVFSIKLIKELIKYNDNLKLFFVGNGNLMDDLKQMVEDENLKNYVYFTGLQNNINEWLSIFDCLLMPSLYEGIPLTLIEAQANDLDCFVSSNIDHSVDLGLNLIHFIELDHFNEWVNNLKQIKKRKRKNSNLQRKEALKNNNYDLKYNVEMLEKIYGKKG